MAAKLAPAEEQPAARHYEFGGEPPLTPLPEGEEIPMDEGFVDGSVILDGAHVQLPRHVLPEEDELAGSRLNRVLIVVLAVALGFTAFIAYLIAAQPD
jgi:hypothetical protein